MHKLHKLNKEAPAVEFVVLAGEIKCLGQTGVAKSLEEGSLNLLCGKRGRRREIIRDGETVVVLGHCG